MSNLSRLLATITAWRARHPYGFILGTALLWCGIVFAIPVMFTNAALRRPHFAPPAGKEDPDTFAFQAINVRGHKIHAWFSPVRPGSPVVLLCHGHAEHHARLYDVRDFLRKAGYAVLSFDFRAHGESESQYTSLGLQEWEDIDAVLREAEALSLFSPQTPLAAYGRSMGAVSLINGAARLPRIGAFLLESPFAELRAVAANDARNLMMMPDCFLIDLVFAYQEWVTGIPFFSNRPVQAITGCGSRPVLLIHDGKDNRTDQRAFDALRKALAAADDAVLTKVAGSASGSTSDVASTAFLHRASVYPEAHHSGAIWSEPERFQREFLEFLANAGM